MTRPVDAVCSAVRAALPQAGEGALPLALVGCSGGPDSLALAAGAALAAPAKGWRVGAVVVDHQLQPGSQRVAARAAEQCRTLGLDPVRVVAVVVRPGGGPEAAARAARYQAFAAASDETGAAAILLGHSLDDQAETVLLGLARGSGSRSLAGMPAHGWLPGGGVALLRPLLGLTRRTLAQACADWHLDPWQDPHNHDPAYARVRVRHDAVPALEAALGPGVAQGLARTARLLRDDDDALSDWAGGVLSDLGRGPVDCAALATHPAAIRRRVLQRLVWAAGSPPAAVTSDHLFTLDRLVVGEIRGPVSLPGRVEATRTCGRLELYARQE